MCHENEEWCKIWRRIDLSVQIWHEEFDELWAKHWKMSEMFNLMGCFWQKYIIFELENYRGVMLNGTKDCCKIWRKTDLCFQERHD